MFYVHILKSKKDGELYSGSTSDLRKRFADHNAGRVFATRLQRPLRLVYYEAYIVEKDARDREHNLKLRANALNQLKLRIQRCLNSD